MAQGVQWSNINKGAKPNDNFSFLNCMIMMLADSVIYMLLTLYIENVFPGKRENVLSSGQVEINLLGEYGIPQRWYYPVTKTYWFGYDAKKIRQRTKDVGQGVGNGHVTSKTSHSVQIVDVTELFLFQWTKKKTPFSRERSVWK